MYTLFLHASHTTDMLFFFFVLPLHFDVHLRLSCTESSVLPSPQTLYIKIILPNFSALLCARGTTTCWAYPCFYVTKRLAGFTGFISSAWHTVGLHCGKEMSRFRERVFVIRNCQSKVLLVVTSFAYYNNSLSTLLPTHCWQLESEHWPHSFWTQKCLQQTPPSAPFRRRSYLNAGIDKRVGWEVILVSSSA